LIEKLLSSLKSTVSLIVTASILSTPPIVFITGKIDLTSFDKIPTWSKLLAIETTPYLEIIPYVGL